MPKAFSLAREDGNLMSAGRGERAGITKKPGPLRAGRIFVPDVTQLPLLDRRRLDDVDPVDIGGLRAEGADIEPGRLDALAEQILPQIDGANE